jgi:hypothetical protein
MEIPTFNHRGIVPPFMDTPTDAARSPYQVRLIDAISRFSTSPERRSILDGFLKYRTALHASGVTIGFQWINGSFLENIELLDQRSPRDIDVVSFFQLPVGMNEQDFVSHHGELFKPSDTKEKYSVDAYAVLLEKPTKFLVQQTAYWYSLLAHRRDTFEWKGFVEISLAPDEDTDAGEFLIAKSGGVL